MCCNVHTHSAKLAWLYRTYIATLFTHPCANRHTLCRLHMGSTVVRHVGTSARTFHPLREIRTVQMLDRNAN